jgi:uncharacterized membrane protein YfcA
MTFVNLLIPFLAAILGGMINSVAGGGSFITFPSLISVGVLPVPANATSTVALWPGTVAAAYALRKELVKQHRAFLLVLVLSSLAGGIIGALLLLNTPQATFVHLIPFLMFAATLLFALSPMINAQLKRRSINRRKAEQVVRFSPLTLVGVALLQLVIATYGGYFGGGIGILMLASFGLMGMENIHEMNALKNPLAACINGVAVVMFIVAGAVVWPYALTMLVGSLLGGFGGAAYARRLNPNLVRSFVILVGCVMTAYFAVKYFF